MNATGYASRDRSSVMGGLFAPWPVHPDGGFDPSDPDGGRPEANAEASEWAGRMSLILGELSDVERSVFHLRFVEELSAAEIGASLGMSVGAAEKRVTRVRNKLRKMLGSPAEKGPP